MDKESFRHFGYRFVDWMVEYFKKIETLPVKPPLKPGEVWEKLPEKPPVQAESMNNLHQAINFTCSRLLVARAIGSGRSMGYPQFLTVNCNGPALYLYLFWPSPCATLIPGVNVHVG